ncbi:MAG: hypothetical protein QM756_11385 [Polyangiaceae bacterium]
MADRYERQMRLREVGELGQARIARSEARIPSGSSVRVELAYLERAGVERARIGASEARHFPHGEWFRFTGPLRVARGASAAIDHLLTCLDLP